MGNQIHKSEDEFLGEKAMGIISKEAIEVLIAKYKIVDKMSQTIH